MAINYSIRADVIDIANDVPLNSDAFLIDTNVLYWMTYSRAALSATKPMAYQTTDYPNYTHTALVAGAKVYHSGLSLAELAHIIERTEREIFEAGQSQPIRPKIFRHNHPTERANVCKEIKAATLQVMGWADPLPVEIDEALSSAALERLSSDLVDGYDGFILESMKSKDILQIVTDDGDFATVAGIQLFTANKNVIQAAKDQGKLITRT